MLPAFSVPLWDKAKVGKKAKKEKKNIKESKKERKRQSNKERRKRKGNKDKGSQDSIIIQILLNTGLWGFPT